MEGSQGPGCESAEEEPRSEMGMEAGGFGTDSALAPSLISLY